ncbi:N [Bobaya virus]|uniref:Nucleoprotein n=1 Tax=Bobaya virus TaxID=2818228 RepID=A0A8A2IEZ6_9VIRU|nr:N [Bobaya virus] [Bobaya virus]QSV51824.1 N [Bobaya virus] [Bobaya virus]
MADFTFTDIGQRSTSTFDPELAYANFSRNMNKYLTVDVARVFFLNHKKAKDRLRATPKPVVNLTFGTATFQVANNHYPDFQNNPVTDGALTLHRLSGYLARWLMNQINLGGAPKKQEIFEKVIIPLAEIKGCSWSDGPALYLGFAAGAEMFLETFTFFPLAIEIQRVLKDKMDVTYMRKVLRQRYGNMTAEEWMSEKLEEVTAAVNAVGTLPWARSGISAAAREFLQKFNIRI